jgi:hypothetical protein
MAIYPPRSAMSASSSSSSTLDHDLVQPCLRDVKDEILGRLGYGHARTDLKMREPGISSFTVYKRELNRSVPNFREVSDRWNKDRIETLDESRRIAAIEAEITGDHA